MRFVDIVEEIRILPIEQRKLLINVLIDSLIDDAGQMHSLLELDGLGAEIWTDIDAQEYVNELRNEWDHRP